VPQEFVEEIRPAIHVSRPVSRTVFRPKRPQEPAPDGIRLGQRVRHGKFGEGVIMECEGQGQHARVHVNFERAGAKWLVLAYARLELM
jgi:DNA helicase-2/ATP-dependent DNA helicase PcrA